MARPDKRTAKLSPTHGEDAEERGDQLRKPAVALAFGPFRLDPGQRRLFRFTDQGDEPVALGSRALDLLLFLVRSPGELASKAERV